MVKKVTKMEASLVESRQLADPLEQRDGPTSIELSREIAVQRVFQGGVSIIAGVVLFGVENALPGLSTSISMQMAAMGLGGLGLVQLGRAAKHFLKYGSRASVIGFAAAAGLGLYRAHPVGRDHTVAEPRFGLARPLVGTGLLWVRHRAAPACTSFATPLGRGFLGVFSRGGCRHLIGVGPAT